MGVPKVTCGVWSHAKAATGAARRNVTGDRTPGNLSPEEARLALFWPLGIAALMAYGLGSSCWCLEMAYCADMSAAGPLGRWVWRRLLHTCWHCGAALGAHLLSQLLTALWASREGLQPRLAWWGVPVVVFGRDSVIKAA